MNYGDQWDQPNTYNLNVFINNIPYPVNDFPQVLASIDPEGRNKTTYFNDIFPWVKDEPDGGDLFSYDMKYYCADDDADVGDFLIFDMTYSDGSLRPPWMGIDYYSG